MSLKEELLELLKDKGLDIAEEALKDLVEGVFEILPVLVSKTENTYDDLLVPMLGLIKPKILEMIDKIDGEVDA